MIKTQVTQKQIKNGFSKVIAISYCGAQYLLTYQNALYYTCSKMYGWRADVYIISNDIAIVTGYAPFGNISPDYSKLQEYENKAAAVYNTVRNYEDCRDIVNGYLNEFIKEVIKEVKTK